MAILVKPLIWTSKSRVSYYPETKKINYVFIPFRRISYFYNDSSNPVHGEVYSMQLFVIMFVSEFWKVTGFLRILCLPPPIKTDPQDINEILLKVASSNPYPF